jgi:hypothetical protein
LYESVNYSIFTALHKQALALKLQNLVEYGGEKIICAQGAAAALALVVG